MTIAKEDPPASALYAVRTSYEWFRTWRYVIVHPSVKHVGFAAATFSNKRGHQVFPGVKRLITVTGYSKPSVIDALAVMRWLGFIYRISCAQGSNGGKADKYQLTVPRTLSHVPMADSKSGKEPDFYELPPLAQHAAVKLGVATRLAKGGGQLSQPGGQLTQPPLVNSVDLWWLSELTPPRHRTNTSTKSDHQNSDRHDRRDSGESRRQYDLSDEDDCYEYVLDQLDGDLDPAEASTVDGMLSSGQHPKAIVNTIRKMREAWE